MGEPLRMLARLGRETVSHHAEADADVDRFLFGRRTTALDYRIYLARIYGFVSAYEAALAQTPGLTDVIDVEARVKTPLLIHDLLALGMTLDEVDGIPLCVGVPSFRGPVAALGWMYVAERPLLASAVIRRHLATRLPLEMAHASSYLACYAGQVGARWRELGEALDRLAETSALEERIVFAAHEAFRMLQRWRTHDLQQLALAV